MIYLLLLAAIVSVAQCGPTKPVLVLSPDLVALITEKTAVCQIQTKADPFIVKKLLPWRLEESETNGRFLYCLMKEMDFEGTGGGYLNENKFMEIFDSSLRVQDKEELGKLLAQCNKEVGKNQYFTIYKVANCFHTKSPVTMSL